MTAIEQLVAAGKILDYAKSLGFAESRVEIDSPETDVRCDSLEAILEWMLEFATSYLDKSESEWIYLNLKLRGSPKLEICYVDEFGEEFDKLDEEAKETIRAKLESHDYKENDEAAKIAPYLAVRLEPGGVTVKWPDGDEDGDETPIVPSELKDALRGILSSGDED